MSLRQIKGFVGLIVLLKVLASVQPRSLSTPMEEKNSQNGFCRNKAGELDVEDIKARTHYDVSEKDNFSHHKLSKRYILVDEIWRIKNLTYKILSYPDNLDKTAVDAEIARAFDMWSNVTDLTFTPTVSDSAIINIEFLIGGYKNSFSGNMAAYAFRPLFGGDVHFNKNMTWTINSTISTDLFRTAVHEFGHALGLYHSDVPSSVMAPRDLWIETDFKLDPDDIAGIHALYGKKQLNIPQHTENPNQENGSVCDDLKIDAILKTANGQLYAFKNDKYYEIGSKLINTKLISVEWPGLEANIDAAVSLENKTYFFKDTRYWRYNENHQMDEGYPREIMRDFPGIPDQLDAAMACGSGPKLCFFKDSKLLTYNISSGQAVVTNNLVSNWEGWPTELDAATETENGYTYFFKNDEYFEVNFNSLIGLQGKPIHKYSLKTLFGCQELTSTTAKNDYSTAN